MKYKLYLKSDQNPDRYQFSLPPSAVKMRGESNHGRGNEKDRERVGEVGRVGGGGDGGKGGGVGGTNVSFRGLAPSGIDDDETADTDFARGRV